jgi:hypothetical protein
MNLRCGGWLGRVMSDDLAEFGEGGMAGGRGVDLPVDECLV